MSKFYRKRTFLAPASTGHTSYVLAEVESSNNGDYPWGTNMLTIADCRRRIQLEFFLGKSKNRKQSLAKADLLIQVLTEFRQELAAQIDLIEATKGKKNAR